jgi:Tol biopolymer transport system component
MSMSPQQDESDRGGLERQHGRQRRWSRRTTIGAFAVAAAISVATVALILGTRPGENATTQENASIGTGIAVPNGRVPEVDYTIDLNTGVMTPLPKALIRSLGETAKGKLAESQYAGSPDGSLVAYVGTGDEGSLQIFIAGIDGTGVRQVTHDPTRATSPAWSPDGRMMAYAGYGSRDVRNFFVLDVATGETRQVTDGTHDVWDSQFTPDGSSLLYTGGTNQVPLLMTVRVAGGKSTLLIGPSEGMTDAGNGSLSPDGSLVTFLGGGWPKEGPGHCGPCRFVANADGTGRRVIPGWMSNPAGTWSPDGGRIVSLGAYEGGDDDIRIVDIATGKASLVAKGNAAIWLDRHTLLVEV